MLPMLLKFPKGNIEGSEPRLESVFELLPRPQDSGEPLLIREPIGQLFGGLKLQPHETLVVSAFSRQRLLLVN